MWRRRRTLLGLERPGQGVQVQQLSRALSYAPFGLDGRARDVSVPRFFVSSRSRHTRFDCDWSSDVCSSDLDDQTIRIWDAATGLQVGIFKGHSDEIRSEERRVGKECRTQWSLYN